jgi:hypothetical protein
MKTFAKLNVFLAIMMVVGLSLAIVGCEPESPTEPSTIVVTVPTPAPQPDPEPEPEPTPTPEPTPAVLLDTTVSLNANAMCYNGSDFCADGLTFIPRQTGKVVTIRATGPSNMDPDMKLFTSDGTFVTKANSYNPGSETLTFTPGQIDLYRLRIYDYNMVGGVVRVLVTQ